MHSTDKQMKDWGEYVALSELGSTASARKALLTNKTVGTKVGCAFATSVNIPGETAETSQIGFDNRGFLRDPIMSHRVPLQALTVSFLETNISFIDHIIRPWVILGTHMGFAARKEFSGVPGGSKYGGLGTDMTVVQFAKADYKQATSGSNEAGMVPRKIWIFKDCIPIKVENQDMTYGIDNDLQKRAVEWQYRRYQVYFPNQVLSDMEKWDQSSADNAAKSVRRTRDLIHGKYHNAWSPNGPGMTDKVTIKDIHRRGEEDPMIHSVRGNTYFKSDQFFGGKSHKDTRNKYNRTEKDFNSIGESRDDLIPDTSAGHASWRAEQNVPVSKTGSIVTGLKEGGLSTNDPDSHTIYKPASKTEIEDAHLKGAVDPSSGEDDNTGMAEKGHPVLSLENRRSDSDYRAEVAAEEDVGADWAGSYAGGNAVHDAIHGLERIGMWGARFDHTAGYGVSNMMNLKKAKKIKTGSGIFGLLGF